MSDRGPAPQGPSQVPPALVFFAVAAGGLGIGFGIAATILFLKGQHAVPAPPASALALPAPEPPAAERSGPWTSELHADQCAAPCCGGAACRVSADNAGKNRCREGDPFCERCASTISCIPGACGARLEGREEFGLHLASIIERGPSGELDACKTQRDLWLCLRRRLDEDWQCLSQREACSSGATARSPGAIAVTGDDLLRENLVLEVRENAPDGPVLARREGVVYRDGMQRLGLCGGFRRNFDAGPVTAFTFYLDRRQSDDPAPARVPASDAGGSATPPGSSSAAPAPEPSASAPSAPVAAPSSAAAAQ